MYLIKLGLDNKTEEAWIQLGWSAKDGRKELILVAFVASAMTLSVEAMFGYNPLVANLPCESLHFEETFAFMFHVVELHKYLLEHILALHSKDLLLPWELSWSSLIAVRRL